MTTKVHIDKDEIALALRSLENHLTDVSSELDDIERSVDSARNSMEEADSALDEAKSALDALEAEEEDYLPSVELESIDEVVALLLAIKEKRLKAVDAASAAD